ncbi:hypothetical protein L1987_62430 [Smallanthus sonchifolius]|uniref:Uncharacterized protein n=1 Tax=Smallanthus sonchifolius TaxID=185202 RepID=A0ACB9CAF3_9ASTR|nr:hypothetical protein L1987_62430 [Smallanthus sonchifolius]
MSVKRIGVSLAQSRVKDQYLSINVPGLEETESDEGICVFLNMPGVKKKDVKAYIENGKILKIKGETNEVSYEGSVRLPKNVDKSSSDMKGEMKDGIFKLTLPKLKDKETKTTYNIFDNNTIKIFKFKFGLCVLSSLPSVFRPLIMWYMVEVLCPKPFNSFSMYKEQSAESLHMSVTPGREKMELTREGACVSLNMPGLEIEDVKSYFKGDIFFIEGKTKTKANKLLHYITGIHLPKSILKKRSMIETEMKDGMYKATLPNVISEIKFN